MSKTGRKRVSARKSRTCAQVLIAKVCRIEQTVDLRAELFIKKAMSRHIADYMPIPSKVPELARNRAIMEFLKKSEYSGYKYLFFLDDDSVPFNEYAIDKLVSLDKPVVAGVTPIVRIEGNDIQCMWSAQVEKDGEYENIGIDELSQKPFKASRIGGTCILIKREVLQKLPTPYQKTTFNPDCTDVELSEDIYFAESIKKAGYDLWVDPNVRCHHYHNMDMLDLFAAYQAGLKRGKQL